MAFYVGQRVVCVKRGKWSGENDHPYWSSYYDIQYPRYGDILTIRTVVSGNLRFDEIRNPITDFSDAPRGEVQFRADRFRPIVERETDISIFKRMLEPQKETA